ncbi:hypothetical protein [Pisciglobus halotolerans]|uniref:Uncharacterized protein n=1 Tax=Pisciglobus halotolerans TaxID=745365 RepID=A0A1I3C3A5_9LACT|nr:hypothetical protein [Pisciglobus halotolerans]SFH68883.1 hypothetical protein SAMN04489868_11262 [Pisciglobus halotolerans]
MKVWVVVIEKKDGTSEIVGVFKDVGDAMVKSEYTNKLGNDDYKEIYIQEHEVVENTGQTMNLKEFSEFAKRELEK